MYVMASIATPPKKCNQNILISHFIVLQIIINISSTQGNAQFLDFRRQASQKEQHCDLFSGEWIYDPSGPAYSSASCDFISDGQNCTKYGRIDKDYLHWRWRPYGCELPPFDPYKFLNAMENKSFGGIGDSLMRNQMESLVCLLSKVEKPVMVFKDKSSKSGTWHFPSHNFTLGLVWNRFLLKTDDLDDFSETTPIHLDILDGNWTSQYHNFDYVLIGVGPWFAKDLIMLENDTVVGCHNCHQKNVRELGILYPYRKALDLAFRLITSSNHSHKPKLVIYRSHEPNHFEHGLWHVGFCNRTVPYKEGDDFAEELSGYELDQSMQMISKEEFAKAAATAQKKEEIHIKLLDIYHLSLLRPDGHPNRYRPNRKVSDCLHWCLPGVIDTWNDLLMVEMLLENEDDIRRQSS